MKNEFKVEDYREYLTGVGINHFDFTDVSDARAIEICEKIKEIALRDELVKQDLGDFLKSQAKGEDEEVEEIKTEDWGMLGKDDTK